MKRISEHSPRKPNKRRRSSSEDRVFPNQQKLHKSVNPGVSSSGEFDFLDYKRDINKIFAYSRDTNTVTNNLDDFWVFINKYQATLRKAGKPVFSIENENRTINDLGISSNFSKFDCINFSTNIKFMDSVCDERGKKKLTKSIFDALLNVVSIYLDFKNKEKLEKLKKLRQTQRDLPVAKYREEIRAAVKNERVIIVAGDTGCGKSTQVPQYLHDAGFQNIACTQPRRIACVSLSKRVAFETLTQFESKVGYQIRFEKSKSADTKICFITEGLLLRQMSSENLPNYDVIILDEIHERHLMGDFLLGVLKCLIHTRTDIKLVLMSATINIKLFEDYFAAESAVVIQVRLWLWGKALDLKSAGPEFESRHVPIQFLITYVHLSDVLMVPGRLYPIDLNYKPIYIEDKPTRDDRLDPQPYVQIMQLIDSKYPSDERGDLLIFMSGVQEITSICDAAEQYAEKTKKWIVLPLHSGLSLIEQDKVSDERGDLLIFMSGVQEITSICDAAEQYAEKTKKWIVLPLHSGLSLIEQDKVFDYPPEGVRKCIVSTNIAETSVTIDGIRFVVDSGKVKEMSYDSSTKMQRLKEFWISKASADQRKGRAGRTGPGVCYRIYSEQQYIDMEAFSTPEVSRVPLASLLLLMSSLGVNDVRRFPFLDKPPEDAIENALLELKQHAALSSNEKLTSLGKALANLPVEVALAKALVIGGATLPPHKRDSALALTAALGIRSIFTTRAHRDFECENARKPDESDHGDPLTLLSLYCAWLSVKAEGRGGRDWCRRRGIEEQRFYELTKLAAQLRGLLQVKKRMTIFQIMVGRHGATAQGAGHKAPESYKGAPPIPPKIDNNLMETVEPESMSSAERALRHGQMKYLKNIRRQYKQKAAEESKRKKRLKVDSWEIVDDKAEDDNVLDIRDIEFRMTNDAQRIRALISGSSASSGRDLIMLKIVLCRALYPQVAIADEFNHCKSVSDQLYHTYSKPFVFLHPTSYFGKNGRILQLTEADIQTDTPPGYKSKLALSARHQLLCYLSLLETTKPYIVNSMRMPAAQTLLLLSHSIDTNCGFTRLVCDSWLLLEFPYPETGMNLLLKAIKLRRRWDALINRRLLDANPIKSVESELEKTKISSKCSYGELQHDLSCDISSYMNSDVSYTIKRLLPGDLKVLYYGADEAHATIDPNPFEEGFECRAHEKKGGVNVTDNVVYNCVVDTDWSYNMYQEIYGIPWTCPDCDISACLSPLERLQHKQFMCFSRTEEKKADVKTAPRENKPNAKEYKCENCNETLYMTPVEILKHRKTCKSKT
ncbi:putative ATP-dependent RNA helicase DHX34 [Papilio xuthus]|uniref:Putative ATP-dependent RNA helicase DHX34 n=1 Tax=Papilio xuthus TaxID=66420 RepID=A0A194QCI8_PAPXU|nr:putative ATP-dependent RNA helicase DHX34 [Papilio xuthus]